MWPKDCSGHAVAPAKVAKQLHFKLGYSFICCVLKTGPSIIVCNDTVCLRQMDKTSLTANNGFVLSVKNGCSINTLVVG